MQYKTAEVTARCKGLTRVNIYKNRVKLAAGLPILPNREALQVSAPLRCALLLSNLLLPQGQTSAGLSISILYIFLQQDMPCFLSQGLLFCAGGADALILHAGQHRARQGALAAAVLHH